ncbi:undecaprenyl-diphosphate phosphatase [Candidatus Babeliales bacterium]|nr:undecaprenyl-diphosphate phosphatase [Candidatus Babeliales bacterium]MBP9843882.1 undecaprenyl-diphosphate phosphatase [Candidatus Babeliales bacterium]
MLLYLWMIVQIVCESLPISSSGHSFLLQQLIYKYQFVDGLMSCDLWAFDYVLQGVSAAVIFFYFFPFWWELIVCKPISISSLWQADLWKKTVPKVFLFGLLADGVTFLFWYFGAFEKTNVHVACGFILTGIILWLSQFACEKKDIAIWSLKNALIVGAVQGLAIFPGISRFGATVTTLQWLGYQGRIAFAISFLLQWPLSFAGALKGFFALHDSFIIKTMMTGQFFTMTVLSCCVAYGLLVGVGKIIDKKLLWKFSYYMIIPSIIALLI